LMILWLILVKMVATGWSPSRGSYRLSTILRNLSDTKRFMNALCSRGSNRNMNEWRWYC
jgi:hypothetical protein